MISSVLQFNSPATYLLAFSIALLLSFPKEYELDSGETSVAEEVKDYETLGNLNEIIENLAVEMENAAKDLAFEKAASLRDKIKELKRINDL